jgi:N-glycosylase/DNA lyase
LEAAGKNPRPICYMPTYGNGTAYIDIPGGIDLAATFDCGQAFRWRMLSPGVFEGIAGSRRARISMTATGISITPCGAAEYEGFWRRFLDLDADYNAFVCELARDETLQPMVMGCCGMRLLNQPIWECLVSFIISSNNNVRRITGIIERLCSRYGQDMGGYHAFPTAEQLVAAGEQGIFGCGAGYRAGYIARTASAVAEGFDLERLPAMGYQAAKVELMQLHGVGEKVADCVLLFSCGYRQAFPVDVWVRRAVTSYYPDAGQTPGDLRQFAAGRFGRLAGLAQQYLFHYERVLKPDGKKDASSI